MLRTFSSVNLGCKVNRVECDAAVDVLLAKQLNLSDYRQADIVIINTCTVTSEAEKKTRKAVRGILAKSNAEIVVVTGCSVAIHPETYANLSERIRVVPKAELLTYLESVEGPDMEAPGHPADAALHETMVADFASAHQVRRGIKIQDGCDNACTYCIVHTARGRSRSKPSEDVCSQAQELLSKGCPELVLTGINLGAYQSGGQNLAGLTQNLLGMVTWQDGMPAARIRLSSIEPDFVTDELIEMFAKSQGELCRHFHLPLQAGSERVLREMGRHYSRGDFLRLIDRLHECVPGISLSTDIIVGFPGETDDDFQETLQVARHARFTKIHVFPYSKREGTPAAVRTDQIDDGVKKERARLLRQLSDELAQADKHRRAGTTEYAVVLPEHTLLTESYHQLNYEGDCQIGRLIRYNFPR